MEFKSKKPMTIMLICVLVLFGGIFLYKIVMGKIMRHFMLTRNMSVSVSTTVVKESVWKSQLKASASLRAVQGVNVTTQLAGMVDNIYFIPGSMVAKDTVLVQLNADTDIAQLHALEAQAALAKIVYKRDKAQFGVSAVSQATLDSDEANLKNLEAQVMAQADSVRKKTIKAPFTGHLGVCQVNLGQYLNPGDSVVSLQQLNPIYIDFFVPQQALAQLKMGQEVTMSVDVFPGESYHGKITTINPVVDSSTRNVEIEATVENPKFKLIPGMFTAVTVETGSATTYMTLPQAAVSYNPFGNIVYIVNQKDSNFSVTQSFVETGEVRGDQVAILKGLKKGQTVVTSGQLKLKNGSPVVINNAIEPSDNPHPVIKGQ